MTAGPHAPEAAGASPTVPNLNLTIALEHGDVVATVTVISLEVGAAWGACVLAGVA